MQFPTLTPTAPLPRREDCREAVIRKQKPAGCATEAACYIGCVTARDRSRKAAYARCAPVATALETAGVLSSEQSEAKLRACVTSALRDACPR